MGIIGTIIVGLIVGALARFVHAGRAEDGLDPDHPAGHRRLGAAGVVGQALGWYQAGQGAGWIASVLGAVLLLFVVQQAARQVAAK